MDILCVDQFSELGGGQRSLLDLLPAFRNCGWEVAVVTPEDGPFPAVVRSLGCDTGCFRSGVYSSTHKSVRQMIQYTVDFPRVIHSLTTFAQRYKIRLLYVNGPRFLPAAAWVARKQRVPLIFHCHSRIGQQSAVALAGVSLRLSRARVIGCCHHAITPLERHITRHHLSIVYNGISLPSKLYSRDPDTERRIGVLGRIEPEKGQLEFVQAAKILSRRFSNCRFYVAGAPVFSGFEYYDEVRRAAVGLPIEFPGWQSDSAAFLSMLDALVVPSSPIEATTRVIPEAYSAGIPVIAFPSGGIPEILSDGETGFLAKALTPEALAERIISVLQMNTEDIRAVVERARLAWQERFSLASYQQQVCDIVSHTLALAGDQEGPLSCTIPCNT